MIKLILAFLLISIPFGADADTFFIEQDKQKHMALSALGANLMYAGGLSKWEAFGAMMLIGAVKEATDDNTATEHGRDMLANAIGASTVFTWSIKFK